MCCYHDTIPDIYLTDVSDTVTSDDFETHLDLRVTAPIPQPKIRRGLGKEHQTVYDYAESRVFALVGNTVLYLK